VVYTYIPLLVKGLHSPPKPLLFRSSSPSALEGLGKKHDGFCVGFGHPFCNTPPSSSSKLPKLNFPSFDEENPKLWISLCEDYFDMY